MQAADRSQVYILIPVYQPDSILVDLIHSLQQLGFSHFLVVNDGSTADKQAVFTRLSSDPQVTVLAHPKNLGKGAALKTGLQWLSEHAPNALGVITVDADGQHSPQCVEKILNTFLANPNNLILGTRNFDQETPWRSRFGNQLTRKLFHHLYKTDIKDTQTGLRAIPARLFTAYLTVPAQKYEYEMLCLVLTTKLGCPIQQVDISTIYIEHNKSSHFNPIVDSVRIYYAFLRYYVVVVLTYLFDLGLFVFSYAISGKLLLSLLIGRLFAGIFLFKFGWLPSFRKKGAKIASLSYFSLLLVSVFISFILIVGLKSVGMNTLLAKALVDTTLFIVTYFTQRLFFFRNLMV